MPDAQADTLPPLPAGGGQETEEGAADSCAASSSRQPERWPSCGRVRFHGVSLRYSEQGPFALMDVHLDIQPGEKIGIVGRTGMLCSGVPFSFRFGGCSRSFGHHAAFPRLLPRKLWFLCVHTSGGMELILVPAQHLMLARFNSLPTSTREP